jgi:predicted RNA-binding protein YlxR (DUF448 family)
MKDNIPVTRTRHIPQRTCIACRQTHAKRELVRLVSVPDGEVEIDATGKKSGRGAYLCAAQDCWESALATGKLEFALKTKIKSENREKLVNYSRGFNNTNISPLKK